MVSWAVGVDVGGTKIAAGVVDAQGQLYDGRVVATPIAGGATAIVKTIERTARELAAAGVARFGGLRPAGVGIGTGGQVDVRTGRIVGATAILPGWAGTDLRKSLEPALGVPVWVDNDAKAMARAELAFGAARGLRTVVFLTLGTGVGGALAADARIVDGAIGLAGHLGHIPVRPEGRPCSCGQRGCLEAYASGTAILSEGRRQWAKGERDRSRAGDLAEGPEAEAAVPNASAVWEAYRRGEIWAAPAIQEARWALGVALQGLVHALNPEAIVIGGGLSSWGQPWCDEIEAELRNRVGPAFTGRLRVRCAQAGPRAGVIGAALLAL